MCLLIVAWTIPQCSRALPSPTISYNIENKQEEQSKISGNTLHGVWRAYRLGPSVQILSVLHIGFD